MKVAVFSTKPYDEQFLAQANQASHSMNWCSWNHA